MPCQCGAIKFDGYWKFATHPPSPQNLDEVQRRGLQQAVDS